MSSTRLLDAVAFNETLAKLSTAYWRTLIVAPISDRPELTAAIAASNAAMDVLEAAEVSISEVAIPVNSPEPAVTANVFDPKAVLEDVKVKAAAVARNSNTTARVGYRAQGSTNSLGNQVVLSRRSPGLCSRYRVND